MYLLIIIMHDSRKKETLRLVWHFMCLCTPRHIFMRAIASQPAPTKLYIRESFVMIALCIPAKASKLYAESMHRKANYKDIITNNLLCTGFRLSLLVSHYLEEKLTINFN